MENIFNTISGLLTDSVNATHEATELIDGLEDFGDDAELMAADLRAAEALVEKVSARLSEILAKAEHEDERDWDAVNDQRRDEGEI